MKELRSLRKSSHMLLMVDGRKHPKQKKRETEIGNAYVYNISQNGNEMSESVCGGGDGMGGTD